MRKIVFFVSLFFMFSLYCPLSARAQLSEAEKAKMRAEARQEYGITDADLTKAQQRTTTSRTQTKAAPRSASIDVILGIPAGTFWKLVLLMVVIGLIPAGIAKYKGRSFIAWWVLGILFFIAAFPASLFMKGEGKKISGIMPARDSTPKQEESSHKQDIVTSEYEEKEVKSVSPALEAYEKIERLSVLKNKGIITQEEFEAKKRELLDRI